MIFTAFITLCILFGSIGRIFMKKATAKRNALVCSFFLELTQLVIALPLFWLYYQTPPTILYSLLAGSFFSISLIFYFASFTHGEVSLLSPLRGLRGIFALIYSLIWWHEALSVGEVIGVLTIGIGILMLQKASQFEKLIHFLLHKEALFMCASVALAVISSYYDKRGVGELGIYTHYLWTTFSSLMVLTLGMLIKYHRRTWSMVNSEIPWDAIIVGLVFSGAYVFHLLALELERVTIVNGLLAIGTLVTTLMAGKYLKESITEKLPGTFLVMLGTFLMSLL